VNPVNSGKSKGKVVPVINWLLSTAPWRRIGSDLGTRWRWVVSFMPRSLYLGERASATHWIRGCAGPTAVLNNEANRRIFCPCWKSNPDPSDGNQSLYRLSYIGSALSNCLLRLVLLLYSHGHIQITLSKCHKFLVLRAKKLHEMFLSLISDTRWIKDGRANVVYHAKV
jgi:hypothetical protein